MLSDLDSHPRLNLAIDGASEADPTLNLVDGEGVCKKFIAIVDENKMVVNLGGGGLALLVEVMPFYWKFKVERLEGMFEFAECVPRLRTDNVKVAGMLYVTDNENYIVDLYLERELGDLNVASDKTLRLPGVVEHGMFLGLATTLIVTGELDVCVNNK
uniref:ribose-5-phosphate isomerase n=1 Tax=Kalanchoe fedtschenkoi TaxID=63787 RepID=A0A7N0U4W1_KALFE